MSWRFCCGLLIAFTAIAFQPGSLSAQDAPTRGSDFEKPLPTSKVGYRRVFAVIVGSNYRRDPKAEGAENAVQPPRSGGYVNPLNHAESDATTLSKLLTDCYGFKSEDVHLLVGKEATKQAVEEQLLDQFLCAPDNVTEDDAVLIYFSGHGLSNTKQNRTLLAPHDVKVMPDGQFAPSSAIDLGNVVGHLTENCKARHKLLILDCCQSGGVFRISLDGTSDSNAGAGEQTVAVFEAKGFQAMTACRENQDASDGDGKEAHAPFTNALLSSLRRIPASMPESRHSFTTNDLFARMRDYLSDDRRENQSALCRWITKDNQGEFHFFPDPQKRLELDGSVVGTEIRERLLATTPSTFGYWWAEEAPWFVPELRWRIVHERTRLRSTLDDISFNDLRRAAQSLCETGNSKRDWRLKYVQLLLQPQDSASRRRLFDELSTDLKRRREDAAKKQEDALDQEQRFKPSDLHFLAVLNHLRGDSKAAEETYEEARRAYAELNPKQRTPELQALASLCELDWGMFLFVHYRYDEAARAFSDARRMLRRGDQDAPGPFRVYTLWREADSLRKAGEWPAANAQMTFAVKTAEELDRNHPLTAAAYKASAWGYMEQWRIPDAVMSFRMTSHILRAHNDKTECEIDDFHVRHGLAMASRYAGDVPSAINEYRQLTFEIARKIQQLQNQTDQSRDVQSLLHERLVNGLERLADCHMFDLSPDWREAADDYYRAYVEAQQLPDGKRRDVAPDILYRRAIALSVEDLKRTGERAGVAPSALASHLVATADEILGLECNDGACLESAGVKIPLKVRLSRAIARTLSARRDGGKMLKADLQPLIRKELQAGRQLDRDELERMMFGLRLAVMNREVLGLDDFQTLDVADDLLRLCRVIRHPDLLAYLRPYYEVAFAAHHRLMPEDTKTLLSIAWEATRGEAYLKPSALVSQVAVFTCQECLDEKGDLRRFVMVDVPNGSSQVFAMREDVRFAPSEDSLKQIPFELVAPLSKATRGRPVYVWWRDPVRLVGYSEVRDRVALKVTPSTTEIIKPADLRPAPTVNIDANAQFPFQLEFLKKSLQLEVVDLDQKALARQLDPAHLEDKSGSVVTH